ncbi:uncharacterized protein LOC131927228 isoform X2 [Physella acuta]|nr:uncharacterized protein LOC131927228 isoform X2 [Physella acuta]
MPEYMKVIGPQIYNSSSAEMSTEIFFNHLKAVNDVGKYQAFKDALHSANYEVIVKVLEGEKIEDDSEHKELMQLFESTIIDSIDPSALAQRLLERDVIDPSEREYIENLQTKQCAADAAFYLLDCVPRRKDGWFKIFLEVLDQLEHKDLVKILDEKFYQQSGDFQPGELSLQVDTEMTNEMASDTTHETCNEITQQTSEMTVERSRYEATVGGGSGSDEICSISIFMQQVLRSLNSLQEQVNRIETNLCDLHVKLDSLNKIDP